MRKLLLFIAILCCTNCLAEETQIALISDKEKPVEKRNLVPRPNATIDGHILRVYTSVEEVVVNICRMTDSTLFTLTSNSTTGVHTFAINLNYPIENILLQIQIKNELYYGIIN